MSAMKIKKGDTVKVIAGKDNGKEGKVLAVNAEDNTVVVENINAVAFPPGAAQRSRTLSPGSMGIREAGVMALGSRR